MDILTSFENKPLLFSRPKEIISCYKPDLLPEAFKVMESFLRQGYYLAGFVSYEAGHGFEDKLRDKAAYDFPLIYMGCYDAPCPGQDFIPEAKKDFALRQIQPNINFPDYRTDIQRIRSYIQSGDVYQITYCLKMKFSFQGDARSLYHTLLEEQPVPYPAYLETKDFKILSLSPEMFMKKRGAFITTKPMKGTWPRGKTKLTDTFAGLRLKYDQKNRAENVMIADLLRNDLGRIGSNVKAPKLFEVARYTTLYQMTSTVTATIDEQVPLRDLFRALFPSGSVTGAPKMRAMQIIRELEDEERKIYTGAIGYITPGRDLFFNIPIRTILLRANEGEMGIGGGIVWDSTPDGEWDEGMLKARFLTDHEQV